MHDLLIGVVLEIGFLGNILSEQLVVVFNSPFLPCGVRVCEIDCGMENLGNVFVPCELCAVVSRYGEDCPMKGSSSLSARMSAYMVS